MGQRLITPVFIKGLRQCAEEVAPNDCGNETVMEIVHLWHCTCRTIQ